MCLLELDTDAITIITFQVREENHEFKDSLVFMVRSLSWKNKNKTAFQSFILGNSTFMMWLNFVILVKIQFLKFALMK